MAEAHHDNFTDRGVYFNLFAAKLGAVGSIDGTRALRITAPYAGGFFDTSLQVQRSTLLLCPSSQFPEVGNGAN